MARVVLEHLSKVYSGVNGAPVRALSDLNLAIENQQLLVLVGPSGCGKTTTLRLLAGLEEPSAGSVSYDGHNMNGVPPKDRDVAMVFQSPALYPHLTVYENLAFGLRLRKHPRAEVAQRVKEAASLLGLEDCLERLPMDLSGGQRQRVAIGRALVRRPSLFLFDEPLSNLDPQLRSQMRLELARLHQQLKATTVYVTHDQVEAMLLGDRLAVLKAGILQQAGAPSELYERPANLFVAEFIGSPAMNLFRGRLEGQPNGLVFFCNDGSADMKERLRLPVPHTATGALNSFSGKEIVLGLRPEHIRWLGNPAGQPGAAWAARVQRCETTGAESYLQVICAGQQLTVRAASERHPQPGEIIQLAFEMQRAHFFDPANGLALRNG